MAMIWNRRQGTECVWGKVAGKEAEEEKGAGCHCHPYIKLNRLDPFG